MILPDSHSQPSGKNFSPGLPLRDRHESFMLDEHSPSRQPARSTLMNPDQWADPAIAVGSREVDAYDRLAQLEDLLPGVPASGQARTGSAYDEALNEEA
jgi:hypothetical protein